MTDSEQVTAMIEALDSPRREICQELRALIMAASPKAEEKWKWSRPVYWAGGKYVCYFVANAGDVNLGFEQGAHLPDPQNRLKGTGANMRHLKFKRVEEIDAEYVAGLLREAFARGEVV